MGDNELIERFWVDQGGKPRLPADIAFYENDWNMLMPVVGRIVGVGLSLTESDDVVSKVEEFSGISIICPIKGVHEYVVKFIKFYNNQKH